MNIEKLHRDGEHLNAAKKNEKMNYFRYFRHEMSLIFNTFIVEDDGSTNII